MRWSSEQVVHRFDAVANEIDDDLFEFHLVAFNGRQAGGDIKNHLGPLRGWPHVDDGYGVAESLADIDFTESGAALVDKIADPPQDLARRGRWSR